MPEGPTAFGEHAAPERHCEINDCPRPWLGGSLALPAPASPAIASRRSVAVVERDLGTCSNDRTSELTTLRLLIDPPLPGPANMARDEALMIRVGEGASPPTLRLYNWAEPTISLGYFQKYADYEALEPPARGLPVVRRLTGGGAILHDLELTYSLTLPTDHPLLADGPNRLYEMAHDAVIAVLRQLHTGAARDGETDDSGPTRGPFFCFARRHRFDVLVGADKLAGSAQRRTRQATLQHGSIILANRFEQQPTAELGLEYMEAFDFALQRFPAAFAAISGAVLDSGVWDTDELSSGLDLIPKYSGDEWTRRI
jgi:lipoate-protein ligase A